VSITVKSDRVAIEPGPPGEQSGYDPGSTSMHSKTDLIDKFHGLLSLDAPDRTDLLVVEEHAIEFVRSDQHFRPECSRNELSRMRERFDHIWTEINFGLWYNTLDVLATAVRYCASRFASICVEQYDPTAYLVKSFHCTSSNK
jgi:hypothetical protein